MDGWMDEHYVHKNAKKQLHALSARQQLIRLGLG